MTRRVVVLSPFVGGDYYGAVLAGINRAATADGCRILAVQTLDPGSTGSDYSGVPQVRLPLGWRHADAAVVLPGATDEAYVGRLLGNGRPVVTVSWEPAGLRCPTVSADNHHGVREAVRHLYEHGHRRIGFGGNLAVRDVRQRYEGYCEQLRESGIEPTPDLLFPATDNHETGGLELGEALLDAGMPVSAIVLGTDRNAIGLRDRLTEAGVLLPDDLAMVGFDDIADARFLRPSLSSVSQPLDRLGAVAYDLVRAALADPTSAEQRTVPARFVARDSCGCVGEGLQLSEAQARRQFAENAFLQQTLNAQYDLGRELLRTHEEDPRGMSWMARTQLLGGCLALWPDAGRPGPVPLEVVGDTVRPLRPLPALPVQPVGSPAVPPAAVPPGFPVCTDPLLETVGAYRADGGRPGVELGVLSPVSSFPPDELFEAADAAAGDVVFVVPVRSRAHDWGYLSAVGRIQDTTPPGRETMNHAAALLAAALDHDLVLRSLHEQQERLRQAALHDQLTGLPNRTLLLDRMRQAGFRAGRADEGIALLFIDLNGFKRVNDTLGHAVGDQLLVHVARGLAGVLRRTDTAARLGGDEFVVLLDGGAPAEAAAQAVERVHAALAVPLDVGGGRTVQASASIGVAWTDGGPVDPDDLLRRADDAMYREKLVSRRAGA